jgi:hypothetical protein
MILFIIIIIYNFVLLIEIIWLKNLLYKIYFIISFFGILYFLLPVIPFVYILLEKLSKKIINIFKIGTFIFCGLALITGIGSICVLMFNDLLSTDFCRECPFNLKNSYIYHIYDLFINHSINEKKLKEECTSRRCIFNYEYLDSNYPHEYVCNYNPTDEFELVQDSQDIKNNNNNTVTRKKDNIFCVELTQDDIINNSELKNNLVINFYNFCNSNTNFYLCERSQAPDEFELEENFVCPEKDYITKLVIFCMLDVLFNLIFGFFPWKSEYNKYKVLVSCYEPRRGTNVKTYSFSSTLNSSKIPKDKDEDKFEHSPTEMIIVYGNHNNNNNIVNNINGNNIYNNNVNINSNDTKKNDKKINFSKVDESSNNKQKNKTEIKLNKNINVINNINIINNNRNSNFIENETEINLNKENSEQKKNEDEHRVTISYNIDITSAEKITLAGNKSIRKDI